MLKERGLSKLEGYPERLREELDVISGKDFADYFLILWDVVSWANANDIAMGQARGSAAGSLLSYCLGITKVDPVKHGLLFFRFLNPERNDFPDIDLDFEDKRRDEVKEYLRQKWGEDRVAGVATYGTFGVKQAVKTVASTFKVPYNEANEASKIFDTLEEYKNTEFHKKYPDIYPVADKMIGRYRNASAHAAGIVVSSIPMDEIVPIEIRKEAKTKRPIRVIAYDKDEVGEMGLIKLDPLSLKAVTVIKDCINKIEDNHGIDVSEQSLDIDNPDEKVFEEFSAGNIVGIFQAEGSGYANLIVEMGINSFDDLVASNALVRPGSFDTQGATYLAVRDGRQPAKYEHEILKNILEESYGTYIYEEQVMRIAVELAGFTWGKADRLRKIISKKKDPEEFKAYESDFIDGATNFISEVAARRLWEDIEKASSYMFNKSHATAYSIMSYQTMWLKVNYPKEFMWATLHNEDKPESITTYVFESIRLGFDIYGPDVNLSDTKFSIDGDGLRFGLEDISGVGAAASKDILGKKPFDSYDEFCERVTGKVNVGVIDALEKVGAFESVNHIPYEKERYFGHLLNYPISIKSKFDSIIEDCGSVDDGIHIIRGLVKETKRTPKYFRIVIEDSSGTYSGFANRDIAITKKDYIIAMVAGNTILHIEDFNDVDTGSETKFAKFLLDQVEDRDDNPWTVLYEKGLNPGLNEGKYSLGYIFNTSRFVTKKGQDMASVYWYIPNYGTMVTMLFGDQIIKFNSLISDDLSWKMVKLIKSKKGNGHWINDIQNVETFCTLKGIII
jgi:DNA polymerase-3 subunit alpha